MGATEECQRPGGPQQESPEWWSQCESELPALQRERVTQAAGALLKWLASKKEQSRDILEDEEEYIHLLISLQKTPEVKFKLCPVPMPLVHPIYDRKEINVCLIVKDKEENATKEFKEKLVPGSVRKVIGARKLKKKYESYEACRQFVKRYDLFLADKRMISVITDYIGKEFSRRQKCPAFVDIVKRNAVNSIRKMRRSTFMYERAGSNRSFRVGWSSFTPEQIAANVFMGLRELRQRLPDGWNDVQSVFLHARRSATLPVYQSLPNGPTDMPEIVEEHAKPKYGDDAALQATPTKMKREHKRKEKSEGFKRNKDRERKKRKETEVLADAT